MAYDVLAEVFSMDPYTASKGDINQIFANMDDGRYELQGDVRYLKAEAEEARRKLQFTGGNLRGEFVLKGQEQAFTEDGEDSLEFSDGQMIFLDFAFQPNEKIDGQFSLNVLGNVAEKRNLEFTYGDRGLPLEIEDASQLIEEIPVTESRSTTSMRPIGARTSISRPSTTRRVSTGATRGTSSAWFLKPPTPTGWISGMPRLRKAWRSLVRTSGTV
jgi:hypothetical protein